MSELLFYESSGTDHEWQTWLRDLKDLAQDSSNSRSRKNRRIAAGD
jgi:hypothetical protein